MMTRSAPSHSNSNLHRPRVNCFDLPVSISSLVANVSCQGLNAISSSASMSGLAPWIALALGKCPVRHGQILKHVIGNRPVELETLRSLMGSIEPHEYVVTV